MTAKCFIASETHFKEVSKIQKFINSANNGCANVVLCRIIIYIEVCIIVFMLLFFLKIIYNYLELLPKNILSVIGMHRYATCRFIFLRTPFKQLNQDLSGRLIEFLLKILNFTQSPCIAFCFLRVLDGRDHFKTILIFLKLRALRIKIQKKN